VGGVHTQVFLKRTKTIALKWAQKASTHTDLLFHRVLMLMTTVGVRKPVGSERASTHPFRVILVILLVTGLDALRVCTSTACKKAGSRDSLETFRVLTACANEALINNDAMLDTVMLQQAFSATKVDSCGCLGNCGKGPNVVSEGGEVFNDVHKPATCVALLQEEGITVPESATKAWVKRMYAMRALRANNPKEALGLLTSALNEAGSLRHQGATLLSHLLELRADVHEQLRDQASAEADRAKAQQMRGLKLPA